MPKHAGRTAVGGKWAHGPYVVVSADPAGPAALVGSLIAETTRRVWGILTEQLAPHGLSAGLHGTLTIIRQRESVPQGEVARLLDVDAPTMAALADFAIRSGWVARWRSPADRRRYELYLTDSGERVTALANAIVNAVHDEVFAVLDPDEQAALHEMFLRVTLKASTVSVRTLGALGSPVRPQG
jgi:DNA-binding MarR family transcriptional regulator